MLFLNNVKMKSLLLRYGNKKVMLEMRRFILKHLQNLSKMIANIERARCMISPKSQFYMDGINAVGFICIKKGRRLRALKMEAILL